MEINYIAVIGLIAGACTTLSFLPQLVKTVRLKETKDLSLSMYIVLATGLFLWATYGIFIKDIPVIIANSVSFILASVIILLKIKYG